MKGEESSRGDPEREFSPSSVFSLLSPLGIWMGEEEWEGRRGEGGGEQVREFLELFLDFTFFPLKSFEKELFGFLEENKEEEDEREERGRERKAWRRRWKEEISWQVEVKVGYMSMKTFSKLSSSSLKR